MLRPLDEALIDYQKTYRQIFKQPLYEHEQYTKRQLIYNYAEIGSEFINELITKRENKESQRNEKQQQQGVDLSEIIRQWNDKGITVQQMTKDKESKQKQQTPITIQKKEKSQRELSEQQDKTFTKQIQVVKKDKLITKSRTQRNVNYRKQLQILFESRNINMLNAQSMRNHFAQLKPYNHYHSKNKPKRYQDNYQDHKYQQKRQKQQRQQEKSWGEREKYVVERVKYFEHEKKHQEEEQNYHQNYDRASGKREMESSYKSVNDERYVKDNQRRQYAVKRQQTTRLQAYQREVSLSPRYKPQYQLRPPAYFPPPPQQAFPTTSQYTLSSQYIRPGQDQGYKKYSQHQQGSSHNQFYQQNFPKSFQSQVNTSSNNQYFNYENNYRGTYGGGRNDSKGQYRPQ